MFQKGVGVEQNVDEAIRLYTLAADQGDEDSRRSLEHAVEFKQFVRTYSPSLPDYVAIAHAAATWHLLRRHRQLQIRLPHVSFAPTAAFAPAFASVEVTFAARLRVCTSGWASFISTAFSQGTGAACWRNHSRVACGWACMIASRVLGRRCVMVKVVSPVFETG
jgi:hypothetical protein